MQHDHFFMTPAPSLSNILSSEIKDILFLIPCQSYGFGQLDKKAQSGVLLDSGSKPRSYRFVAK